MLGSIQRPVGNNKSSEAHESPASLSKTKRMNSPKLSASPPTWSTHVCRCQQLPPPFLQFLWWGRGGGGFPCKFPAREKGTKPGDGRSDGSPAGSRTRPAPGPRLFCGPARKGAPAWHATQGLDQTHRDLHPFAEAPWKNINIFPVIDLSQNPTRENTSIILSKWKVITLVVRGLIPS